MREQVIALMVSQTITIGMQTSGEDDRTEPHVIALRRLLAAHCNGPYSKEVSEFHLGLFVGGRMQEFDFEGCERVRRSRKKAYIKVEIAFPSKEWKSRTDSHIRAFLVGAVQMGLLCCLDRLRKDKADLDREALLRDFAIVKQMFLAPSA